MCAPEARLPARLHGDYLDLYFTNPFVNSSRAADSYVIAGITDHITPWKGVYTGFASSQFAPIPLNKSSGG